METLRPPGGDPKPRRGSGWGRGPGHEKTATGGSRGQRSGAGSRQRPGFEGGQMPLHRRLPKRGFTNIFRKQYAVVNLSDLEGFKPEEAVTPALLLERGLVKRLGCGLQSFGDGELKAPLPIFAHLFS